LTGFLRIVYCYAKTQPKKKKDRNAVPSSSSAGPNISLKPDVLVHVLALVAWLGVSSGGLDIVFHAIIILLARSTVICIAASSVIFIAKLKLLLEVGVAFLVVGRRVLLEIMPVRDQFDPIEWRKHNSFPVIQMSDISNCLWTADTYRAAVWQNKQYITQQMLNSRVFLFSRINGRAMKRRFFSQY
jgi:hypothetical protein